METVIVYTSFSIQETIDDTIKLLGVQAQRRRSAECGLWRSEDPLHFS